MQLPGNGIQLAQWLCQQLLQGSTERGQLNVAPFLGDQRIPQLRLQLADGLRKGWLGNVQLFGGSCDMLFFCHGHKISQLIELHPLPPFITIGYQLRFNDIFYIRLCQD